MSGWGQINNLAGILYKPASSLRRPRHGVMRRVTTLQGSLKRPASGCMEPKWIKDAKKFIETHQTTTQTNEKARS